jgi:hypothetical protein
MHACIKKLWYIIISFVSILTKDSFDANASSTRMNFDSHEPIHDPGAEDEARTFKESSSDGTHSADGYDSPQPEENGNYYYQQNDDRGPRNQQPTPAQQFDPYYNTGLDYANQLPDQMYGDSQQQDDRNQYVDDDVYDEDDQYHDAEEGSNEGSYGQSSGTGSSAYSQSDGGSYDQGQDQNANDGGSFASAESSHPSQQSGGRSFASVESSQQSEYSDNPQPSPGVHSNYNHNESGSDFNDSGQSSGDEDYDEEYYDEEDQQDQDQEGEYTDEEGSYDEYSDGEEEGLLPPVT